MRDVILFSVVTAAQLVTTVALVMFTFGAGMARFDSAAPAGLAETVAGRVLAVLSFPLLTLVEQLPGLRFPGLLGYVLFASNAALWGVGIVVGLRRWQGPTSRRGRQVVSTWGTRRACASRND